MDGLYAEDGTGSPPFHAATAPTDEEMERLLDTIARRIGRLLARRGVVDGGEHGPDRWAEEAPVLAGIADASVQGRVALGSRAGAEVRRGGRSPELLALASAARGPCHARQDGFDLHAAVVVPGHDWADRDQTRVPGKPARMSLRARCSRRPGGPFPGDRRICSGGS